MAYADYRLCDVCGEKAFYDSNLNYEDGRNEYAATRMPFRIAGTEQHGDSEVLAKYGGRLDRLGDWAVICADCAKTHRTQIVKIDGSQP